MPILRLHVRLAPEASTNGHNSVAAGVSTGLFHRRLHLRTAVRFGAALLLLTGTIVAEAQKKIALGDVAQSQVPVVLRQALRIGSMSGDSDAFGRISYTALRRNNGVLVADDQTHRISVFDETGRLVKQIGRQGKGPGEFDLPWLVAALAGDSIAVWDAGLARISIFAPTFSYVRSFPVPPTWVINSLAELPNGDFLLAALDAVSKRAMHVYSREGKSRRSFAPMDIPKGVTQFESSLLGGRAVVVDTIIVFSHKSPYRIDVYRVDGVLLRSCLGSDKATTPPANVIVRNGGATSLQWRKYVHSTALLRAPEDGVVWNIISDLEHDRRTLDAIDVRHCRLLRRAQLPAPVFLNDLRGSRAVGFMELDFPEVVVYHTRR